jgi:serine/threonine protein kinase
MDLKGYIFGRYRLLDEIGHGGMATVYKAHDTVRNRFVAVKVLSPAMAQDPQFSERFAREAQVVMQLKHPHILPVLDVGEKDGYAYIVMPFMKSGSLGDRLKKGPLKPYEAGRLFAQIASALDYAHRQGIVHRDIKPPNIMMDEKGNAYLADFGLAHLLDTSNSLTGSAVIGTPAYISPEQSMGRKVDARSDQYSLGIVLFQLSTGQVPFDGDTPIAILVKHINDPLPAPSTVNPNVPPAVEKVIQKATAKNPVHRFESLAVMNQMFQAAMAHAVNPEKYEEPEVEVITEVGLQPREEDEAPRSLAQRRWFRVGAFAALLLLLLLACPITSTGLLTLLENAANPVAGSALSTEDLSDAQLTELAATIDALSTEAARTPGATTIVQTVVVTSTVLLTEGAPTPTATPSPTGEFVTATPTRTPWSVGTNPPPPTNPPPQPTNPPPTPKPPTKTPPPPTNPPPTNTPPPPPTNTPPPPPPTNTPPPPPPTEPPYP